MTGTAGRGLCGMAVKTVTQDKRSYTMILVYISQIKVIEFSAKIHNVIIDC